MSDFREVVKAALRSADPLQAFEAAVREHPSLPDAMTEYWADGFATDRIPLPIARLLVDRGAKLSVHAAAGFGFVDALDDLRLQ